MRLITLLLDDTEMLALANVLETAENMQGDGNRPDDVDDALVELNEQIRQQIENTNEQDRQRARIVDVTRECAYFSVGKRLMENDFTVYIDFWRQIENIVHVATRAYNEDETVYLFITLEVGEKLHTDSVEVTQDEYEARLNTLVPLFR